MILETVSLLTNKGWNGCSFLRCGTCKPAGGNAERKNMHTSGLELLCALADKFLNLFGFDSGTGVGIFPARL